MKHIFIVLLLLLCVSCISDRETRAVLDQVEALIEENPAEAYELAKGIDGSAICNSSVNARYALLYTMAEYKNYIDAPTDSLISIAVDYYEQHGSDEEKFYAYLYKGCVQSETKYYGNDKDAIATLLKACRFEENTNSKKDVGLLYTLLSKLYGEQQITDEEKCARKAYSVYMEAGLEAYAINAMGHIAYAKLHKEEYDSCLIYTDSILSRATLLCDTISIIEALLIKAKYASHINSNNYSKEIYNQLIKDYHYNLESQDYSMLACVEAKFNNIDKAKYLFSKAISSARTSNDSIIYYIYAYRAYRSVGIDSLSYKYQDSVLIIDNRQLKLALNHTALASQKEYAEEKLKLEQAIHKQYVLISVIVILLMFIVLVFAAYSVNRKNLLTKLQSERIMNLMEELRRHRAELNDGLQRLRQSAIIPKLKFSLTDGSIIGEKDWIILSKAFSDNLPLFESSLKKIHDLTETEWRVCMLLKLGFSSSEIAKLINKSNSAIPSIRTRLYKKFFMKPGKAADWDDFINSI